MVYIHTRYRMRDRCPEPCRGKVIAVQPSSCHSQPQISTYCCQSPMVNVTAMELCKMCGKRLAARFGSGRGPCTDVSRDCCEKTWSRNLPGGLPTTKISVGATTGCLHSADASSVPKHADWRTR